MSPTLIVSLFASIGCVATGVALTMLITVAIRALVKRRENTPQRPDYSDEWSEWSEWSETYRQNGIFEDGVLVQNGSEFGWSSDPEVLRWLADAGLRFGLDWTFATLQRVRSRRRDHCYFDSEQRFGCIVFAPEHADKAMLFKLTFGGAA